MHFFGDYGGAATTTTSNMSYVLHRCDVALTYAFHNVQGFSLIKKNKVPHFNVKFITFHEHLIAMSMFVLWPRIRLGYGHPVESLTSHWNDFYKQGWELII